MSNIASSVGPRGGAHVVVERVDCTAHSRRRGDCQSKVERPRPGGMNDDTAADVEGQQVQGNPLADASGCDEDDLRVDSGTGVPAVMARLGSAPTNWHQWCPNTNLLGTRIVQSTVKCRRVKVFII